MSSNGAGVNILIIAAPASIRGSNQPAAEQAVCGNAVEMLGMFTPAPFRYYMDRIVEDEGFSKLPVSLFHGEKAGDLPGIHRDPFDRMLVAQAQAEGLELITAYPEMLKYGIKLIDPRL